MAGPARPSMTNMDTESVGSTLSVFSTDEYRKLRTEVALEGKLDIMDSQDDKKQEFKTYSCVLTKDGRLTTTSEKDKEAGPRKYLIEECHVMDYDALFRLKVTSESDLQSKVDEIVIRCDNDLLKTRWLISIESCLRRHLTNMFNEMDCIRGYLKVSYYESYKEYDLKNDLRRCFCFYYHGTFRVKGLDLRGTLSLKVKTVKFDIGKYPSSFIIEASDCDLLCFCDDVDMFSLWRLNLKRDFPEEDQKKAMKDEFSGDLLIKTDEIEFTRVKCTYHKKIRTLNIKDFSGVGDTFVILRCGLTPPRNKADHHFAILSRAEETLENINLYCRASDEPEAVRWVEAMSPTTEQLAKLIKIIVVEIEVRRIFHHESSRKEPSKGISYAEISHMASVVESEETDLTDHDEWTVSKLERAVQLSFKIMPEPLIPYRLQESFNEIGRIMRKDKLPFDAHKKRILELVDQLPAINLDVLQTMGGHVSRLVTHYKHVHVGASTRNTDLTVWRRLSKYILKTPDQILSEKEEEELLKNTAYVLDSLKRHSEEKMKAMKSIRSKGRKSVCKQQ